MELVKPEPLIIGGRAHYTLTSYGPVSVQVDVPYTADEDVEYAMQLTIMQAGGGPAEQHNDIWIHEHFDGISGAAELRRMVREQINAMNAAMAEEQKAEKCAEALAKRLVQRVPASQVAQMRQMVAQSFAANLAQEGLNEADFLAQTGMRRADLEAMFDEQARTSAEHEAAIDAWIDNREITASDDELPELLGIDPDAISQFMSQARAIGQLDQVRQAALRSKALDIITAECQCSYRHETPAEVAARVAHTQAQQQAFMQQARPKEPPKNDHPHLKLV